MWGRAALVLAVVVSGLGITAPAVAAPPPLHGTEPATVIRHLDGQAQATDVAACRATLTGASQWPGGLYATVTVTNIGSVPIWWQVTITLPGTTIVPPPGFIVLQIGPSTWLIYPPPSTWNGVLPVGASTAFGFMATVTGPVDIPTALTCTATPA